MGKCVTFVATLCFPRVNNFHFPIHGHVCLIPNDGLCPRIVSPRTRVCQFDSQERPTCHNIFSVTIWKIELKYTFMAFVLVHLHTVSYDAWIIVINFVYPICMSIHVSMSLRMCGVLVFSLVTLQLTYELSWYLIRLHHWKFPQPYKFSKTTKT
jgi:hypothetical protein